MNIKLEYKDNKAYYTGLTKELTTFIEDQIEVASTNIEAEAVTAAPSKLGFLRNSSFREVKGLEAVIGFNVHYAPYIEFGTGGLVDVPAGLEDYAIQFKGDGIKEVNLTPRPYLFPAFKRATVEMLDNIKKKLNGNK